MAFSDVGALICDDIDTQACQLIQAQRSDMCNSTIADTTCPRFCGKCARECYHCDLAVTNITDCNATKSCNTGEVCMLKELKSSADGHHEYVMTCESKLHCDGADLTFPFGRRDIASRDVNVKCCDTDLCNYPSITTTTVMPTTQPGCVKDVIIVLDESSSMQHEQHDVLHFLTQLVGDLGVSAQGTHVSLGTFSTGSHTQFDLDSYVNVDDMKDAIKKVHLRGGNADVRYGLSYIFQHALTATSGDRSTVPNVVVFITDSKASTFLVTAYEQQLHQRVHNVIAIGVGHHASTQDLLHIATDSHHILSVRDADDLDTLQSQLVSLICS